LFRDSYNTSNLHFVVLKKTRAFDGIRTPLGIRCRSITWRDIIRPPPPQSSLESDLHASLGLLGYEDFEFMKTINTVIGQSAPTVAKALTLIKNVACRYSLRRTNIEFELDEGSSSFGRSIGNTTSEKTLEQIVQSRAAKVTWFGYETIGCVSYLSVWFYCANEDGEKAVKALIPEKKLIGGSKLQREKHFVNVRYDAAESTGDQEWFTKILDPFLSV